MLRDEDFWLSDQGIKIRIEQLSQFVVIRTYNRAIQANGVQFNIDQYRFLTEGDDKVCPICAPLNGRTYRAGQFMPYLPRHQGGRCVFDLHVGVGAG